MRLPDCRENKLSDSRNERNEKFLCLKEEKVVVLKHPLLRETIVPIIPPTNNTLKGIPNLWTVTPKQIQAFEIKIP